MEGERVWKMHRRPPFFFFWSHFETTEICLGCTKMEISVGKKIGKGEIF